MSSKSFKLATGLSRTALRHANPRKDLFQLEGRPRSWSSSALNPQRQPRHRHYHGSNGNSSSRSYNGLRWAGLTAVGAAGVVLTWENLRPDLVPQLLPLVEAEETLTPGTYKDPTTGIIVPTTLTSPTSGKTLQLVGTGVRTVSFLGIRVYTAAIHVEKEAFEKILSGKLKGWENYTPSKLIPPFVQARKDELVGEALVASLLEQGYDVAVTIVPLRNTSLPHLRDGFYRALIARLKLPQVISSMSPAELEESTSKLTELRSFFSSKSLAKGCPLVLHFDSRRGQVRFELPNPKDASKPAEVLGELKDGKLSKELFLSYFSDAGVISEELRTSFAKGCAAEAR
ncbi:hypothetical protein T439DRAFT_320150 [Meredithblackwellia eburnea MCA 4105]